ncbi:MAG: hypothetical protein Q9165_005316 [Trypethelium subeluteriae]
MSRKGTLCQSAKQGWKNPAKRFLAFFSKRMAKRKEVIDLTHDEDEPAAKRSRQTTPQQEANIARRKQKADSATVLDLTADDARFARELQAQYDQEAPDNGHESGMLVVEDYDPQDPSPILILGQNIRNITCSGCRKKLLHEEKDVLVAFKQWLSGTERAQISFQQFVAGGILQSRFEEVSSAVSCPRKLCFAATCMGCGSRCIAKNNKTEAAGAREMIWCCDHGRLYLIWALLCGYDRRQTNLDRRAGSSSSKLKSLGLSSSGVGYGGVFPSKPWEPYSVILRPDPEDDSLERIFSCLTALLPSLTCENPTTFDLDPPIALRSILVHSKILNKAAELLRNDSLEDATRRLSLYQNALKFVGRLGSHPSTARTTIHEERPESQNGTDLLQLSFSTKSKPKGKSKIRETNQSIATCLAGFDHQSKLVLQRFKADSDSFKAKDSQDMLTLCRSVLNLTDFLLANSDRTSLSNDADKSSPLVTKDSWQQALALLELPDQDILPSFHFAKDAAKITKPPLGRMKALTLELARLSTSLPPGIFVRHGSTRLDIMKILIIGPRGTPYENGLFEFDLLCGAKFPHEPPAMQFKTTAGGKVRFNPNLYESGKVCLSLLGTWSGEPWQPGSSTILQVLLSIQAMIFCEEPWCNEPGREGSNGTKKSKEYNRTVQGWTAQHAMGGWLKDIGGESVWSDVVMQHFQMSGNEILARVQEWGIADSEKESLKAGLGVLGVVC